MNRMISEEKKVVLDLIFKKVTGSNVNFIKKELASSDISLDDKEISPILAELKDLGLVSNKNGSYYGTLLGSFASSGLDNVYEAITRRQDLLEFFKTRIPGKMPKDSLLKFKISEDFRIIGKPDFEERVEFIMNEAFILQPSAEKEMLVASNLIYRPNIMYMMSGVLKKAKLRFLVSSKDLKKESALIKTAVKFSNIDMKVLDDEDLYMGTLCIDDNLCIFGFRNLKNVPGWDAVIYTKESDCINWVIENFEYLWNDVAKDPSLEVATV